MNIPKSLMAPFGYTGMPHVYCREMAENFLAATIKDIVEKMEERQKEDRDIWIARATANPAIQEILQRARDVLPK